MEHILIHFINNNENLTDKIEKGYQNARNYSIEKQIAQYDEFFNRFKAS